MGAEKSDINFDPIADRPRSIQLMLGRRAFLKALGTTIIGARVARPRQALAASGTAAKRLIVFFSPNGSVLRHWRPTGSETNFSFPAGSVLEPLADMKDHLVVVDGLDFKGTSNHEGGMSHMLTGGGGGATGGASVDQYIAQQLGPGDTRFPSLEFGVQTSAWGGSNQTRMSYLSSGNFVAPNDDPAGVHRRLFGDLQTSTPDVALLRRRSVLDAVRGDIGDLQRKLGAHEKQKLEAHLEALRTMEAGLQAPVAVGECTAPSVFDMNAQNNDAFPAVGRAQTDMMITALACGMTNVASLQWSHTVSPAVFSWLGISEGHHALSHMDDGNTAGVADFIASERWFAEQFLYLLQRLQALPEPGGEGSMLDNSLVVWAKEMGDSRLHVCESVPFVLAGGANGCLPTGRYLEFPGESHTKLLVSICHAMGLDNPTFGDPSHGTGALAGLLS